jgi:sugar lactone lactonase YvrE
VAISPDGAQVYAAGRTDGRLVAFDWLPDEGGLHRRGMFDSTDAPGLGGARAVAVSRDGRRVYVASQFGSTVVVFAREPGEPWPNLTYLETWVDGLDGVDGLRTANGLALSRDGRNLYASGYDDDAVAIFRTGENVYLPVVLR